MTNSDELTSQWFDYVCQLCVDRFLPYNSFSVLDFGGGNGFHYGAFNSRIDNMIFDWHLVEKEESLEKAKSYKYYSKINCYSDTSEVTDNIDIIYSDGVIQYIKNYKLLLKNFAKHEPYYIFLHRVTIGDHDNILASQTNAEFNYGAGEDKEFWFINENKILRYMKSLGYHLYYKKYFYNHPAYKTAEDLNGSPDVNSFRVRLSQ